MNDSRFQYALPIAKYVCSVQFQTWLADSQYTAIGEAIFRNHQHLVDYKGVKDHVRSPTSVARIILCN